MVKLKSRWQLGVGLFVVVFIATACFQSVGDVPQGNVVSERSTETNTPIPTPIPTEEEETEEVDSQVVDQPISDVDTPTPTNTNTPVPTLVATQVAQSGEGEGGDTQPDTFQLTSTALIRQATEVILTQQAATEGVFPTADTGPTEEPTLDPFFATQTAQALAVEVQATDPNQPVLSGTDCVHEVRQGETMYRIATTYYGLPVNTVAARNGVVNPTLILPGQRFVIPGCGTTGFRPPATSTPIPQTTFGTGGVFGTQDPGTGGGIATTGTSVSTCGSQYIVQQFDSLFQISLACNVPVQSIANANGIVDINYIKMGDVLTIPPQ